MKFSIIDGHADTACSKYVHGQKRLEEVTGHVTLDAMKKLEGYAQFFAYCPVCYSWEDKQELFELSQAMFEKDMQRHSDVIAPVGNKTQMLAAWEAGKTAAFQALEGAEGIGCDPGRLENVHGRGFRMVSLMWNYENPLGGSNLSGGGLTEKGREFVRHAQELHMLIDVSHASSEVFFDICDMADRPFVASHSNCRALCDHPRNLTDQEIRCLKAYGGIMGLNLYPPFLTGTEEAAFEDMRRHLEYALEVGGEDVIALGGDLDGISVAPEGFGGVDDYNTFADYLACHGFSRELLEKLCAGNMMRVMDACDLRPL